MEEVKQKLEAAILQVYGVKTDVVVTVAPEDTGADFASNVAMQLAKLVHKAPVAIAEELKDALLADAEASGMAWRVEIAGPGFMNFISPDEYFYGKVADFAKGQEHLTKGSVWSEYDGKVVVCEFSDPNPFKVLHVGHLYTSMVGDSISRILEMAGAKVVRANFGGDVGLHVGKTIWALLQQLPSHLVIEEIAKAYVEGTRAYEEDEQAKAEITEINRMVYEIALQEFGDIREWPGHEMGDDQESVALVLDKEEIKTIYLKGRELSYKYFEDFYARIGVKFDRYYPESTVAVRGLKEVRQGLDRGVYEESNGAVVYKGEKFGLHTRVFINQNDLPTYEAKDVGLIFTKWDDYHFDESVVITGNDIIEYMKVVLASVSEMAPKLSERTRHLTHGQVKLPGNEKMSSRKGNFLKAVDVIGMVTQELVESTGQPADEKVVLAALRYAFLKYKMGGDIIFDPKESVAMTGNSGVYLLYSTVRAKKVLQRVGNSASQSNDTVANSETSFVRKLSKKIIQYQDVLKEAVAEKAPNKICVYLFELAQEFSRFYENVKVIGNENEAELIVVVQAYTNVMEHGLGLLGIEVPEEM
jgi:arginyl-tRNA synthetase